MAQTVRCGIIGAGGFAEICHIPGLQSHPDAEVVALCGRNADRLKAMTERTGVPDCHTDYRELLARDDIDAIALVTPNVSHHPIAMAALEAGKHVFCEKPLAMNAPEAREMEAAAEQARRVGQVAFTFRFLHGMAELRRRVAQGDIGKPYFARVRFEGGDLRPDSTLAWRHYVEESGGGVLQDMGSHALDMIQFALEPVAELSSLVFRVPRVRNDRRTGEPREATNDDFAAAYWRTDDGLPGEFAVSRITNLRGGNNEIEVFGETGSLRAEVSRGHNDRLLLERPGQGAESLPLPEESSAGTDYALGRMMRSFVDAILGREALGVEASFTDGRRVQEAIDAVERSEAERRWMTVGAP